MEGQTVLFYAACYSFCENIIEYLVEHGADVNKKDKYGETPIYNACHRNNKNIIKYLVENGTNLNEENEEGETVLFRVCRRGNKDIVEYLVEHGADIGKEYKEIRRKKRNTVLTKAFKSKNKDLVIYLINQYLIRFDIRLNGTAGDKDKILEEIYETFHKKYSKKNKYNENLIDFDPISISSIKEILYRYKNKSC